MPSRVGSRPTSNEWKRRAEKPSSRVARMREENGNILTGVSSLMPRRACDKRPGEEQRRSFGRHRTCDAADNIVVCCRAALVIK